MTRKGQTSMIVIVLMIIIMMGMGVFLLFSSIREPATEFNNYYAHNLLISVLRTHTGYGPPCTTVSETVSSAYLHPGTTCQGKPKTEVLEEIIPSLMGSVLRGSLEYYMVIEPESWDVSGGRRLEFGREWVDSAKNRWVANEKVLQYGSNLRVKLVISEK